DAERRIPPGERQQHRDDVRIDRRRGRRFRERRELAMHLGLVGGTCRASEIRARLGVVAAMMREPRRAKRYPRCRLAIAEPVENRACRRVVELVDRRRIELVQIDMYRSPYRG